METNTQSNWFVGAYWRGAQPEDQTPRFLEEGLWENGNDDRYQDHVRSMQPRDKIAIKVAFSRRNGLPFDNRGKAVWVMRIKAIGTVIENLNDGKRVRVDWGERDMTRDWFSIPRYGQTVHLIEPGDWNEDALLAFAFEGIRQDIDLFFRNDPRWRERFGDGVDRGNEGRQANVEQEVELTDQDIHPSVPDLDEITEKVKKAGHFSLDLCRQLHCGLWANDRRHFAILTGISGSGKTLLAGKYGEALTGGQPPYFCEVPVQPGWTDPSFLLGYVNPLKGDSYERTRFLELLLSTERDPAKPHVALLDEMNLSHPEQYLAPVLSAMETGNELELHGREGDFDGVPRSIPYPKNLVLIGTVNMDETTMGLSDKILDRAFTLEFWEISVDHWPGWSSCGLPEEQAEQVRALLVELMEALEPVRLHFGFRTIEEVVAFIKQRNRQAPDWDLGEALDAVIHTKVLPKLRGDDSSRIKTAFEECRDVLRKHDLKGCLAKVRELEADLEATGSARFWR